MFKNILCYFRIIDQNRTHMCDNYTQNVFLYSICMVFLYIVNVHKTRDIFINVKRKWLCAHELG